MPTVEGALLSALHRAKLIPTCDTADCEFSRCGRTDKGVSALRQVVSLRVRSLLSPEEQSSPENDGRELDYLHILNQLLPDDVRLYEVALRLPEGFDARFSCTYRRYKYFFHARGLDIDKMRIACEFFKGEHDFRNFCKVDGSKQIVNFERGVLEAKVVQEKDDLFSFDLTGTAFLWHQVRSMVAILFVIGQELEQPELVQDLLDINKTPQRPLYEMASDIPLVLYDCGFPPMEWISFKTSDSLHRLQDRMFSLWHDHWMKYNLISVLQNVVNESVHPPHFPDTRPPKPHIVLNLGSGKGKNLTRYVPLSKRERQDPPELINERWRKRKNKPNPGEVFEPRKVRKLD